MFGIFVTLTNFVRRSIISQCCFLIPFICASNEVTSGRLLRPAIVVRCRELGVKVFGCPSFRLGSFSPGGDIVEGALSSGRCVVAFLRSSFGVLIVVPVLSSAGSWDFTVIFVEVRLVSGVEFADDRICSAACLLAALIAIFAFIAMSSRRSVSSFFFFHSRYRRAYFSEFLIRSASLVFFVTFDLLC